MNENPEGTPNPLNPNSEPQTDLAPEPQPMPEPMPQAPATDLIVETTTMTEETVVGPAMKETVAKPESGKKSKKTMWIIVAIVAVLVAIGCAIAAVFLLGSNGSNDKVPAAITKLLNGEGPKNVAMDGIVNIVMDESSDLSAVKIDFNAELATVYNTGKATAEATLVFVDDTEITFDVDDVVTADGDIYLQINGLSESIADLSEVDATEMGELAMVVDLFELVEGQWIRIPTDSMTEESMLLDNQTQCLVEAMGNIGQYSNSLVELYNQNQFITYSTENVKIEKKQDTIYRLGFDDKKLAAFINSFSNSGFANEIKACAGEDATNEDVTELEIEEIFADYPIVYVEINDNNDFTRVYFDATTADGMMTATADFSLSYPATIEITEPAEYKDINDLFVELFSGFTPETIVIE